VLVLLPWLVVYSATGMIPPPRDAFVGYLGFEHDLPVIQWTEVFYGSTYVLVMLVPLLAKTRSDLREFGVAGLLSMVVIFPLYFLIPLQAPARAFVSSGFWGDMLLLERQYDAQGRNACPSYHVFWALLAAMILARRNRSWRMVAPLWAVAIAVSCVATGQHAIVDIAAAFLIFPVIVALPRLYERAVAMCGRVANSFRAWQVGPLRIVNHAVYSGLAAAAGILMIGTLTGPAHLLAVGVVAVCTVVGAGLWAQLIEGSPRLLRPFGYYGAIAGGILGTLAAPLLGSSTLLMLAAFATASPVIQAIGRVRCLVQGCCHGRPLGDSLSPRLGYRVTNASSRVCKLSPYADTPIHPTPLYSILGNVLMTVPLIRLWMLAAPLTLIAGLYLVLAGLARFAEEAYRGEPQTRCYLRLTEYQWYAIVSVVVGGIVMVLPFGERAPAMGPNVWTVPLAVALGGFTAFAMSTDFPGSNARFARLTG
jgi:prolipoprotein diacylglyceryltransferase